MPHVLIINEVEVCQAWKLVFDQSGGN